MITKYKYISVFIVFMFLCEVSLSQERQYWYYTIHNTMPNVTLTSQKKQLCFFNIEDLNEQEEIYFYVYGSEFDIDKDKKYNNSLAIYINDKLFWGQQTFTNNGFGTEGKIGSISFIIKKFAKEGMNTAAVVNLSDKTQKDYAYIQRFVVDTKRKENIVIFYMKKSIIPVLTILIIFVAIRIVIQMTKK